MSIRQIKRMSALLSVLYILACVFNISTYKNTDVYAEEISQTAALKEGQIYVYNNAYNPDNPKCPVVYVTGLNESGYTIRVYDSAEESKKLLGAAKLESTLKGFTVSVPVSSLSANGGNVYVTAQKDNYTESEPVKAAYTRALNTDAGFKLTKINTDYSYKTTQFANSFASPTGILKDSYYQIDVLLYDFPYVGTVTLPIRYNTDYFELVPIIPSTSKVNTSADGVNAPGENFSFVGGTGCKAAKQCGILPGKDTDYEADKVTKEDDYPEASGSDRGEYPYINTSTGLIKLELAKKTYGPFDESTGDWQSGSSVLRLVFRAKQNTDSSMITEDLIHFATAEDYKGDKDEDGNPEDADAASEYYAIAQPGGLNVSLGGANVLITPVKAGTSTVEFPDTSPVKITGEEVATLPSSYTDSVRTSALPVDSVKVYNYSNSENKYLSGQDEGIEDRLVISLSAETSNVKCNDKLTVYSDSSLTEKIGSGEVLSADGAEILLGNKLDKNGGTVYVTNTRGGVTSDAVAIPYMAEANRTVTFKVYRSRLPDGIADGTDLTVNPDGMANIQKGEQIQIRIYFNDINDLMGYCLPIHFNTNTVAAADRRFRALANDGYITEEMYINDESPFSVGSDLTNLTLNELIIYYAEESEIPDIITNMGLSGRDEFDRKKLEAETKIKFGVSDSEIPWKGGLLFTGERAEGQESTAYPYVDNTSGGLVKLFSSAMTSPISSLKKDGGYHFISLNFVGKANMMGDGADFHMATSKDTVYDAAYPGGGKLCIAGPVDVGSNVNYEWEVYSMDEIENEPFVELNSGNATTQDIEDFGESYGIDKNTVFVYNKYKYRDPGFKIYNADGTIPTQEELDTNLKRYYIAGGVKKELPAYKTDEIIATDASNITDATSADTFFGMTSSDYSKVYDLVYEYTDPNYFGNDGAENPKAVTVTRKVVMIYKRGDVNRDGNISEADSNIIMRYAVNLEDEFRQALLNDFIFKIKTANADNSSDYNIGEGDSNIIKRFSVNLGSILQDYYFENIIMLYK